MKNEDLNKNSLDNLKPEYRLFADTYLTNGFNAYQAAIAAGYSEAYAKSDSYKLLENPDIQRYIQETLKPFFSKYEITNERILSEVAKLAFSNVKDMYDEFGRLKDLKDMPEEVTATISSVKTTDLAHGRGDNAILEQVKELKLWNKNDSLKMLMQYKKLLDGDNQTNINNISISDEQLKRVLLEVQTEAKKKFANIRAKQAEYLESKKNK